MARHIKYYKGKVVVSPSSDYVEYCESMFAHGSFVHQKCSNYTLTNLFFGLCRYVWIIDQLVIRPSPHPKALTHPSSSEVLRAKERTRTHYLFVVFTFELVVESIQEFGGASINTPIIKHFMMDYYKFLIHDLLLLNFF
jgi:hypothetical protein